MLTLQNQNVADEKWKYFPINLIYKIKLQLKDYLNLCDKSDTLSHVELRVVIPAQIAIFTEHHQGDN